MSTVTSEGVFFSLYYVDKELFTVPLFGLWLSQASTLGRKLGPGGLDQFDSVHMLYIQVWGKIPN